jgi:hypothetical protein
MMNSISFIQLSEGFTRVLHCAKQEKDEFVSRLKNLKLKLEKIGDPCIDNLFSEEEKELTIRNSMRNK